MSKGNSKKKNKLKYKPNIYKHGETVQTIVIITIFTIGIIVGFIAILNGEVKNTKLGFQQPVDPWEASFREIEQNMVGIRFNGVVTTEAEYELLRSTCNEFLLSIKDSGDLDKSIVTELQTTEEEFVDTIGILEEISESNSIINGNDFAETGPIYLDDMMLVRYVNGSGDLAIISAIFDDETKEADKITLYKQVELPGILDLIKSKQLVSTSSDNGMSEEEYIKQISDNIAQLLITKGSNSSALHNALSYFTYEGKQTIENTGKELNLSSRAELEFVFGLAGKSDTSKNNKDRLYLYYNVLNDSSRETINIIVKLNNNLRIFDIDII